MPDSKKTISPLCIFHFNLFGLVLFSLVSGCSYKCWTRPGGGKVTAAAAKLNAGLHFPTSHSYSQPLPAKTRTKTKTKTGAKTKLMVLLLQGKSTVEHSSKENFVDLTEGGKGRQDHHQAAFNSRTQKPTN